MEAMYQKVLLNDIISNYSQMGGCQRLIAFVSLPQRFAPVFLNLNTAYKLILIMGRVRELNLYAI